MSDKKQDEETTTIIQANSGFSVLFISSSEAQTSLQEIRANKGKDPKTFVDKASFIPVIAWKIVVGGLHMQPVPITILDDMDTYGNHWAVLCPDGSLLSRDGSGFDSLEDYLRYVIGKED